MARKVRDRFGPNRPDARRLARRLRFWTLISTWAFILVFMLGPALLGNAVYIAFVVIFGALAIATTIGTRRPESPDNETLERDELKNATADQPVAVNATWAPSMRVRGGDPMTKGFLICDGKRLRFEYGEDKIRFDTPIDRIKIMTVPNGFRPQLDLSIGDSGHTIRFFPVWDLGAMFIGPTVAGEWYAQLKELGAS